MPEALTHLSYQHIARRAVTDYAFDLFACVPYNLCDAIVRLLRGCPASSCNSTPTELPTAPGAAAAAAAATAKTRSPSAPAAAVPSRQQQRLVDVYDRYLRFLLYDMTCVVTTALYSRRRDANARHILSHLFNALACVVAVQQKQQEHGAAQHSRAVRAAPSPPTGIPPPPPEDTWQLLARAQAAGAQRQAVVDALGLWPSELFLGRQGRAGAVKTDQAQGNTRAQVVLDSGGLQLGRELNPDVAGQVLSCLLMARCVGPRGSTATQAVARGGEAALLLALALRHRAKGLRDLVFAPQLLLPHTGNQVRARDRVLFVGTLGCELVLGHYGHVLRGRQRSKSAFLLCVSCKVWFSVRRHVM